MINGDINEFVDHIYYGDELIFQYAGQKYFLQGWTTNEGVAVMNLDIWNGSPFAGYLWETQSSEMRICAEEFLKAPLFNGKTFWEIERSAEWLDD